MACAGLKAYIHTCAHHIHTDKFIWMLHLLSRGQESPDWFQLQLTTLGWQDKEAGNYIGFWGEGPFFHFADITLNSMTFFWIQVSPFDYNFADELRKFLKQTNLNLDFIWSSTVWLVLAVYFIFINCPQIPNLEYYLDAKRDWKKGNKKNPCANKREVIFLSVEPNPGLKF